MDNTAQNQVQNGQNTTSDVSVSDSLPTPNVAAVNTAIASDDLLATQLTPSQVLEVPTELPSDVNPVAQPAWQDTNIQQYQQVQSHPQFGENIQPVGNVAKEAEPINFGSAETAPVVEIGEMEVPQEVSEYVKKEKKENHELLEKIEHQGQTVVAPAVQNDLPEIVLPMTKTSFDKGMSMTVVNSAKWLAEWCFRVVKKFHGRVVYAQNRE